ncbi:hypothetical protein L596_029022 [Steinernema carpocapsae]|nr:hypothetical protein L596_029022 [Steinernema carpocapsae]
MEQNITYLSGIEKYSCWVFLAIVAVFFIYTFTTLTITAIKKHRRNQVIKKQKEIDALMGFETVSFTIKKPFDVIV